jgi:hypothetical protein
MAERKRQHTVMMAPEQSDAIAALAQQEGRTFNEQVRVELAYALQTRKGRSMMETEKPTKIPTVSIMLEGEYEDWRHYTKATAEVNQMTNRIEIVRGARVIASYDLTDVKHWEIDEPEE